MHSMKLFGGARVVRGLSDVGRQNAAFGERYLQAENIAYVGGSLGGHQARRIQFWPVSGRVRQMALAPDEIPAVERVRPTAPQASTQGDGSVELF